MPTWRAMMKIANMRKPTTSQSATKDTNQIPFMLYMPPRLSSISESSVFLYSVLRLRSNHDRRKSPDVQDHASEPPARDRHDRQNHSQPNLQIRVFYWPHTRLQHGQR